MKTNSKFLYTFLLPLKSWKISSRTVDWKEAFRSGIPYTFIFVFFLFPFSLMWGCSDSPTDNDNTITVSGTVNLEGRTDHSGVKVSLYKPVELDTALVRINQEYPNIGVQISQETEFDHREYDPLYSTTSNATGSWQISGVNPGEYNTVAEKDSFGWKYSFNISISSQSAPISFPPFVKGLYLKGVYQNTVNLLEGQFLIIDDDVIFTQSSNLVLNGNNWLLFNNNNKMEINGGLSIEPNKSLHISSLNNDKPGKGLILKNAGQFIFENLYLSGLKSALSLENNQQLEVEFKNTYVKNCQTGISAKNKQIKLSNCLFTDMSFDALNVIAFIELQNSVFLRNASCFLNDNFGHINNNLFIQNKLGVLPYKGDLVFINNEFTRNEVGMAVNSSNCSISYNDFIENGLDIELNRNYVQFPVVDYCDPDISFNNFFKSDTAISILSKHSLYAGGIYGGRGIDKDLTVANCYWVSDSDYFISQRIYDSKDDPNLKYSILFNPFKISYIPNAGIQ